MNWREYQREAAAFFAGLGMRVEADAQVGGVRTTHAIDVLVTFVAFGVEHRWIVECKHWKRRVSKDRVLALRTIVEDVGADRGFLITETGFQSGAVTAARLSNITLTNLEDLRANAEADMQGVRWDDLYSRLATCSTSFSALNVVIERDEYGSASMLKPGLSNDDYFLRMANRATLERGLERARLGNFPITYGYADTSGRRLVAYDMNDFLDKAALLIEDLETWLDQEVARPWPNRPESARGVSGEPITKLGFEAGAQDALERNWRKHSES